jgi:hypothetical protein
MAAPPLTLWVTDPAIWDRMTHGQGLLRTRPYIGRSQAGHRRRNPAAGGARQMKVCWSGGDRRRIVRGLLRAAAVGLA